MLAGLEISDHQRIFYTISNDYSIDQNCEIRYTNNITFISCEENMKKYEENKLERKSKKKAVGLGKFPR